MEVSFDHAKGSLRFLLWTRVRHGLFHRSGCAALHRELSDEGVMMPKTIQLTKAGSRLYWIYRRVTLVELTPAEFAHKVIMQEPWGDHECQSCGEIRALCSGVFCLSCVRGTTTQ